MQGNFENFCLGAVDIAKHLFGPHIPEKTDDGFHFACSHQGVFFFYLGMWSRTAFFPVSHHHTMLISFMSNFLELATLSNSSYQLHQCVHSGQLVKTDQILSIISSPHF